MSLALGAAKSAQMWEVRCRGRQPGPSGVHIQTQSSRQGALNERSQGQCADKWPQRKRGRRGTLAVGKGMRVTSAALTPQLPGHGKTETIPSLKISHGERTRYSSMQGRAYHFTSHPWAGAVCGGVWPSAEPRARTWATGLCFGAVSILVFPHFLGGGAGNQGLIVMWITLPLPPSLGTSYPSCNSSCGPYCILKTLGPGREQSAGEGRAQAVWDRGKGPE